MVTWAEHRFRLSKPDSKGITQREHLEQVERQLGVKPPELKEPCEFPSVVSYLWVAFCRLSNRRIESNPISFLEIKAWKELLDIEVKPWEIEAILTLDQTFLKVSKEE